MNAFSLFSTFVYWKKEYSHCWVERKLWPSSWYATNLLGGGCRLQIGTCCAHLPSTSICIYVLAPQSRLTLCDPMGCSPPGSSVHGILQARILEWVAIPFSRGSSKLRDQTWSTVLQVHPLLSEPPGKPIHLYKNSITCCCSC